MLSFTFFFCMGQPYTMEEVYKVFVPFILINI